MDTLNTAGSLASASQVQTLQLARRNRLLASMNDAGIFPHEPLGQVLLAMCDDQVEQSAAIDTLLERSIAITDRLDKIVPEIREAADHEMEIIRAQSAAAVKLAETVRVRTEQFSTEQANVMVGAIVNEALASLKGAFLGMWKGELEGAMLDITRPTTIRWAVTGFIAAVITVVSLMGAGAWWEHRHIGYQAMVGGQCLENMVADPKSNVLWCQLDSSQVHKQDQPAAQSAEKR